MSRIDKTFTRCKAENRAAFIPFIMGGDPSLDTCAKLLDALPASGADIIELGIPFSDPMADGPTIQAAGLRALEAGTTVEKLLKLASQFRAKHQTPLVLMGYLNPLYVYGYDKFAAAAAAAGIDGIIIVDLPPEESSELEPVLTKNNIALVRLIAPTSLGARLPLLTKGANGYLYYVSITGITGAGSAAATDVADSIVSIRKATSLPVCVGFGVKTPVDVKSMAATGADGVVVGSAIVQFIHEKKSDVSAFSAYIRTLADGCRR
ncbi:MAG: tryptophan synthase subunit alpha [Rickettsiales bacterium]